MIQWNASILRRLSHKEVHILAVNSKICIWYYRVENPNDYSGSERLEEERITILNQKMIKSRSVWV